jgi:undecaprenyl-diphosphatase
MTTSLNTAIFGWIHSGAETRPVMDGLAVFFGEGDPYFLVVLFAILWFLADGNRNTALLEATEASVIGLFVNQSIGLIYFQPRPYMVGLCTPIFPHGPKTSFPSDHATSMFAAAFYLLVARRWAACGIPLLAVALLNACGRAYSGVHFPFDMAGSLIIGLVSAGLMRRVLGRLNPLKANMILVSDQLTDRFVRSKSQVARKG